MRPAPTHSSATKRCNAVALAALFVAGAQAANIALWSQTSPEYAHTVTTANGPAAWAVWPREVACDLRYHVTYDGPAEHRAHVCDAFRHACDVWESAADLKFVPVDDPDSARLLVYLRHDGRPGPAYHGGGSSNPPRRDAKGALLPTEVRIGYTGDSCNADRWRDDCWVWVAAHELGHALGFWHEFQRPDRDRNLRVDPDERPLPVLPGECGDTAGTAFDIASLMMYAWTDADRDNRFFLVTPETGEPLATINYYQRNGLSAGDVSAIRRMYGPPRSDGKPIIHEPQRRSDEPLRRLREAGWRIIAHPGMTVAGIRDSVVFEAEKGLADHWTQGGNPPRIRHRVAADSFSFSVDLDGRYVPPASFAGMFIVLGDEDWISFGAWENARQVAVQRTGHNVASMQPVTSSKYRLLAQYAHGSLCLSYQTSGGAPQKVTELVGIPRPTEIAFGTRSWPGAEFSYRRTDFSKIDFNEDRH